MSKKNRNKFRNRDANRSEISAVAATQGTAPVSNQFSARSAGGNSGAFSQHTAEYRIISADLIRLVVLNAVMLIAVFALYYVNRSSGVVEKIFHSIIK